MPVPLNRHNQTQRQFIVRMLARFYSPKDIAQTFVAVFPDTACTELDVTATDPTLSQPADPMLVELFKSERRAVLDDPDSATYADQKARLIQLSRQVERYIANNQPGEARVALQQIATEQGIGGKGGSGKAPEKLGEPVEAIEITIVDPKLREVSNGNAPAN